MRLKGWKHVWTTDSHRLLVLRSLILVMAWITIGKLVIVLRSGGGLTSKRSCILLFRRILRNRKSARSYSLCRCPNERCSLSLKIWNSSLSPSSNYTIMLQDTALNFLLFLICYHGIISFTNSRLLCSFHLKLVCPHSVLLCFAVNL